MNVIKLRKCPFCGGEAIVKNYSTFKMDYDDYRVCCSKCGAVTSGLMTKDEAVETWNTRFFDKDVAMQLVELLKGRYSLDSVKIIEK